MQVERLSLKQQQFLDVVTAEEAHRIFRGAVNPKPLGEEVIPLDRALGRVLSQNIVSTIDVPYFDRSNVDGFAVRAQDTFGAEEVAPKFLRLTDEMIHTSVAPKVEVTEGMATGIATGGVIPRGSDAVVMVEYTTPEDGGIMGATSSAYCHKISSPPLTFPTSIAAMWTVSPYGLRTRLAQRKWPPSSCGSRTR